MHRQNRENPGILVTVVTYGNLWPCSKMTKIAWLQFLVTLLALGKIPISDFRICGGQCCCHAVAKIGDSRNACTRSYIVTIFAMSENAQISLLQLLVTLLALGKIPFANYCICGSECHCHSLVKTRHSRNAPTRSYMPKF